MSKTLISLLAIILSTVSLKALALPTFTANDDGTISVYTDPDEYEGQGDDVWSAMQKRFWSPHPSDYNPLRRPLPVPRGSKRDEINNTPYHPIPRVVTMKQRSIGDEYPQSFEQYLEGGRQKKQTRATTLIFRLGSWGLRRKPTDKNAPATPSPST